MSAPAVIVTAPMYTTITVNGLGGASTARILSALGTTHLGPALAPLVEGRVDSLEVETDLAEEVADLVERLLTDDAELAAVSPPLLFSPNVGDSIAIVRDGLFEFQVAGRRAPRIWRFVPRGTRGRVIAHQGETDRVLIEPTREIAYVRARSMTGMRFWSSAPR